VEVKMKTEKKLWLIEQYALKAWTTSLALRQEAARAGEYGREYAIVAHEARVFADKLFNFVGCLKFENADEKKFDEIADYTFMLKLLTLNAQLSAHNGAVKSMNFHIPKCMAVFSEELRQITHGLEILTPRHSQEPKKNYIVPELAKPADTGEDGFYLLFSINGNALIENLCNIKEVFFRANEEVQGENLSIRGEMIPIINPYKLLGLPYPNAWGQPMLIMHRKHAEKTSQGMPCNETFALPVDDLDMEIMCYASAGSPETPFENHAFKNFVQECWEVVSGERVVFVDWGKITTC